MGAGGLTQRKDLNKQTEFGTIVTVMTDHSGRGRSHLKHRAKPGLHQNKHSEHSVVAAHTVENNNKKKILKSRQQNIHVETR